MWTAGFRERIWSTLDQPWDLIIIGGGITGAGILREAGRLGLRALLVEQGDFASGTSSRSSKLVHGGFRYLKNGQIRLVWESVRERERLLWEGRGLVNPLGFLLVNYRGDRIPAAVFGAGLIVYDLLAGKWGHRHYDALDIREFCPLLAADHLLGGFRYFDAQTDDARLVLRVLEEAVQEGGVALNYARVVDLLRRRDGTVCGVRLQDQAGTDHAAQPTVEVQAQLVINATGAWADELRQQIGGTCRLRRLRGSHLIFPSSRLPLSRAISFLHPRDGRPVFVFPWEGVSLLGTTDVDHPAPLDLEPSISEQEVEYLLESVQWLFPEQQLSHADILSTYAGVRPVVHTGKADPSKESREFVLWVESGLLTITGGKLTTFRLMAHQALSRACRMQAGLQRRVRDCSGQAKIHERTLKEPPGIQELPESLTPSARLRLAGRYGQQATALTALAQAGELQPIGDTPTLWAELRWACRAGGVLHLDDLLLRRVRVGLLLSGGGQEHFARLRAIVQEELHWDDDRWQTELNRYQQIWKRCYDIPR